MTREELGKLFKDYLFRDFTEREWKIHGPKNYSDLETEILTCDERKKILNNLYNQNNVNYKFNDKIAILLTGHIRKNSILNGIKLLCNNYNYDIFVHTWDNIGLKGSETNINDYLNKEYVISQVQSLPNLVKYEIENNRSYIESLPNNTKYFNYSSPEPFIKSQLYSINKAYKLFDEYRKENNINYRAVFKFRFDNEMFLFNLNEEILSDINKHDIIFVSNNDSLHMHPDYGTSCWACDNMYYKHKLKDVHFFEHTNVICDLFAYGSVESMRKYCYTYDEYDKINEQFYEQNKNSLLKHNKNIKLENDVHKLLGNKGHIDSLYYYVCSYPERILQIVLKNYMLLESKNVKLKLIR